MSACCAGSSQLQDVPSFADWMSELPEKLHDLPLNQLAIPGISLMKSALGSPPSALVVFFL